MLGLNLNTNMPFSPASGLGYNVPQLEEEVDAVTGEMDVVFAASCFSIIRSILSRGSAAVIRAQVWSGILMLLVETLSC